MRRARSLFDIDQEPLFEPFALRADADGHPNWADSCDEPLPALQSSRDLEVDVPEQRSPVAGRRSRVLVAVAAVGAVGFLGTRLTQDAAPPSALPRTASQPQAVVAAGRTAQPSPPARQGQNARRRRESAHRATRRERTRRAQRAPRSPRTEPRRRAVASPSRSSVPASPPVPVTPPPAAQAPAPEPLGFTGEFF